MLPLALTFALGGCAFDVISVMQTPAKLEPTPPGSSAAWVLGDDTKVTLKEGFATPLKRGTRWQQVGTIQQGDVFHTKDQVVTVEASNQHEADLVMKGNMAVGFYLVVERSFTPLSRNVELRTNAQ